MFRHEGFQKTMDSLSSPDMGGADLSLSPSLLIDAVSCLSVSILVFLLRPRCGIRNKLFVSSIDPALAGAVGGSKRAPSTPPKSDIQLSRETWKGPDIVSDGNNEMTKAGLTLKTRNVSMAGW